jgi:hypothetical protein
MAREAEIERGLTSDRGRGHAAQRHLSLLHDVPLGLSARHPQIAREAERTGPRPFLTAKDRPNPRRRVLEPGLSQRCLARSLPDQGCAAEGFSRGACGRGTPWHHVGRATWPGRSHQAFVFFEPMPANLWAEARVRGQVLDEARAIASSRRCSRCDRRTSAPLLRKRLTKSRRSSNRGGQPASIDSRRSPRVHREVRLDRHLPTLLRAENLPPRPMDSELVPRWTSSRRLHVRRAALTLGS